MLKFRGKARVMPNRGGPTALPVGVVGGSVGQGFGDGGGCGTVTTGGCGAIATAGLGTTATGGGFRIE